ncbi:MAG: hypothetical protein IT239_02155 [Bacteroidia bacterium]|nr:hypothetical protein [Bacteroidia bacterium]
MNLTNIEVDLAKELVNIALAKAADSLSFFIRQKVLLRSVDFSFDSSNLPEVIKSEKNNPLHCLKTSIKGELQGNCYLIFTQNEVRKIQEVTLSKEVLESPEKLKIMGEAILLEIDNIITAAMVTQFSNILNHKMFGYVPELIIGDKENIIEKITGENATTGSLISFKTIFLTNNESFEPEFLWYLDSNVFMQSISEFSKSEKSSDFKRKINTK